jgi:hypothetical protein
MQATAVAGAKPGGGLTGHRSPRMPIAARERGLSINRLDRTFVPGQLPAEAGPRVALIERQHDSETRAAALMARGAVMLALASLAILVLLPAAIAAQAASAI